MTPSGPSATSAWSVAAELTAGLADLALPASCVACGADGAPCLCAACGRHSPAPRGPCCRRCGSAWRPGGCGRCLRFGRRFAFDGAAALWRYAGPVRQLVHGFKYRGRSECLEALGRRMAACPRLAALGRGGGGGPGCQLVVPVPLRSASRRRRRYNQAEGLARGLAAAAGLEVDPGALVRRRQGAAQTGRSVARRRRQLRGALRARAWRVQRRPVLLVDDVMSTGATADAAARALRLAGSPAVHVVTLAT